jgi:hypothetical protein
MAADNPREHVARILATALDVANARIDLKRAQVDWHNNNVEQNFVALIESQVALGRAVDSLTDAVVDANIAHIAKEN